RPLGRARARSDEPLRHDRARARRLAARRPALLVPDRPPGRLRLLGHRGHRPAYPLQETRAASSDHRSRSAKAAAMMSFVAAAVLALAPCHASQLHGSVYQASGAAGTILVSVTVRNTGAPCTL